VQEFNSKGVKFAYTTAGKDFSLDSLKKNTGENSKPLILWAHGWGHTHANFAPLITPLEPHANHIALDFPGFGASPPPPESWDTKDYADAIAAWMTENQIPPVIWIGHSFGCRVGTQIAAHHPECIDSMIFISGAGLKKKRPPLKKLYFYLRIRLYKLLKKLIPEGGFKSKLMAKFGSADYKKAGPMRTVFIRVVNEDLSETAKTIQCPVALVYGTEDHETPPEFGERYSKLIKNSELFLLDRQDHYSVLQNGRHQVIKIIDAFIKERKS